jgi:1-acyl-sn-glycerol-3-phosphate acyltransferase
MSLRKIERVSPAYLAMFVPLALFHRLWYRRFTVLGRHNIPRDKPVIFLCNHQNALMDALAILFGVGRAVVFLARADIFKKKSVARFLYYLKIMPIFRARDGAENLAQNDATFRRSAEVLARPRPMAMFPEGVFNPVKSLLPLKKGFARIAFQAEDFSGFDLHIVPIGLDYDDKQGRFSSLLMQFGEAIPVAPMLALYRENPAAAYNELMDRVRAGMEAQMIDIRHSEYSQTYMRLMDMGLEPGNKAIKPACYRQFVGQREFTARLNALVDSAPEAMRELDAVTGEYFDALGDKISDADVAHSSRNRAVRILSSVCRVLSALLWLPNFAIHLLPLLSAKLVLPRIKDRQFVSSVKFLTWFASSLIYYALIELVVCLTDVPLASKLSLLPALCLHGILTAHWTLSVKKLPAYLRFYALGKEDYSRLKAMRERIYSLMQGR